MHLRSVLFFSLLFPVLACDSSESSSGTGGTAGAAGTGGSGTGGSAGTAGSGGAAGSGSLRTTPPKFHRATAPALCPVGRAPGDAKPSPGGGAPSCDKDSQCTEGKEGRCTGVGSGIGGVIYGCTYDKCTTDDDCGAEGLCVCRPDESSGAPNACSAAQCRLDADCGEGGWCSPSGPASGDFGAGWYRGYACHTPDDECYDDSECAASAPFTCAYDKDKKRWRCSVGAAS